MMSGDCQSQGLAEWLQMLGCPASLNVSNVRKLYTSKMRSVWRHLQAHVVSTHKASTIHKNVLLARLEDENIPVGQFQNFKLDSVNHLNRMKEILQIEKEKDEIKEKIMTINEKLHDENSLLLQKIAEEKWEEKQLSEIEDKTTILELKQAKILEDCNKVNDEKETIVHLKNSKTSISHYELSRQKSIVSKYVKNYRYPFKDTEDDGKYLCEMMCSILEFKPESVLDGIVQNAKEALMSLNSILDSLVGVGDSFSPKKSETFQEKLRDLKVLVIRNELQICDGRKKILSETHELQDEKDKLLEMLTKKDEDSCYLEKSGACDFEKESIKEFMIEADKDVSNVKFVNQLLDDVMEKIQQESENNRMLEEQNRLIPDIEFEPLENVQCSVRNLVAKEDELDKQIEKKVSDVNMVVSVVHRSLIDSGELNEMLSENVQLASDFKSEICHVFKQNIDSSEFADVMLKEVEVFQRTPMVALSRSWDTSNNMLGFSSAKKSFDDPLLLYSLLQAEEKNSIINVLEKCLWFSSINSHIL